jgi:hypothetical protein
MDRHKLLDLLDEDLAAAGSDASPVRSARTTGEAEVLDVVSIGASLRLFRDLLNTARASPITRSNANNDYWDRLATPSFQQ